MEWTPWRFAFSENACKFLEALFYVLCMLHHVQKILMYTQVIG